MNLVLFEPQVSAQTRDSSKPSFSTGGSSEGRAGSLGPGPSSRTPDSVKPQVGEGTARALLCSLGHSLGASRAEGMLT